MRLLLAEDDPALRSVLERGLRENGYVVDAVERGDDALHLLGLYDYALVVLDWRMPGRSGVDVVAEARRRRLPTPILMLTARDTLVDRVTGLDAGADDYLVKPFEFDELLARLRALQRRPATAAQLTLAAGSLEYDPGTRAATVGSRALSLTPTERAILELLLRRRPHAVTRAAIAQHAWEDESDPLGSNTIEVHVARLRAKLVEAGVRVVTVRGIGYRLQVPGESA
jgi:DNA-binding response OmpR family regulator